MDNEELMVKELPIEFVGSGEVSRFQFSQQRMTDKGYIYYVLPPGAIKGHYEVFKRKVNQYGGVSYPKAKSFGIWAWWTSTYDKSLEYLNSFEKKH